jgi:hypothetical protein
LVGLKTAILDKHPISTPLFLLLQTPLEETIFSKQTLTNHLKVILELQVNQTQERTFLLIILGQ